MANVDHKSFGTSDIHIPYAFVYASAAARTGATGFTAADLGKLARQTDDNSLWMLTATTPTWVQNGAAGGGATPDATATAKGVVQLAGDLAGAAAAPTVPGLATKEPGLGNPATSGYLLSSTAAGGRSWVAPGAGGGLANPMTTAQDLIVGGAAGAPTRLGVGGAQQVLTVVGGVLTWATPTSGTNGNPANLTGATAATRYVGGTASGAPTTGTFAVGDFVVAQDGKHWTCTVAGTPGTWVQVGGSAGAAVYPQETPRLWHGDGNWSAGSTINFQAQGVYPQYYPTPGPDATNHPYVEHSIVLAAGTYTMTALGQAQNIMGIQEVWIDGTKVGQYDWYSAGAVNNTYAPTLTFAIPTSGRHILRMTANGKNAASTNYYVTVSYYVLTATTLTTSAS